MKNNVVVVKKSVTYIPYFTSSVLYFDASTVRAKSHHVKTKYTNSVASNLGLRTDFLLFSPVFRETAFQGFPESGIAKNNVTG
jgi:hypothetical protein